MGKTTTFLLLVILGVLGALGFDNREMVTLKIPFGETYEMSKATLTLFSTILGVLVVFVGFIIRDTKRGIDNLQEQKRLKREAKTQETYSKAMNAILGHKEEEAREALADILKESPEHVDALLRLGDIAFHNADHPTALDYYKRAHDLAPRNPEALLGLVVVHARIRIRGELYLKRNQEVRALEEFRAACDAGNEAVVSYCCKTCGALADDWSGRCPQCSEWNAFHINISGGCSAVRPL
ncbi:MAG TPA: tetratricopeptide repeat protein [Dissulfurispiraceae bacterium]|nr:tetratricopeptide repeat protein [Dissulfurispiraceae bacterium]